MEVKKIDVILREDDNIWAGGYSGDQSVALCFGDNSRDSIYVHLPVSRAHEIVEAIQKAVEQASS